MTDATSNEQATRIDALIDENLERVFSALLQEEIPEKLLHVVRMLEARDPDGERDE